MSDKVTTLLAAARLVADRLQSQGNHIEAEVIRRLVRSRSSARELNRRLHTDNMELRRALDERGQG